MGNNPPSSVIPWKTKRKRYTSLLCVWRLTEDELPLTAQAVSMQNTHTHTHSGHFQEMKTSPTLKKGKLEKKNLLFAHKSTKLLINNNKKSSLAAEFDLELVPVGASAPVQCSSKSLLTSCHYSLVVGAADLLKCAGSGDNECFSSSFK